MHPLKQLNQHPGNCNPTLKHQLFATPVALCYEFIKETAVLNAAHCKQFSIEMKLKDEQTRTDSSFIC